MAPPETLSANHRWQPDLVCGIDFGMTCTGVAYAHFDQRTSDWSQLRQIKRWPGRNSALEKVPTELVYTSNQTPSVRYWGAECKNKSTPEELVRSKRLFKNALSTKETGLASHGHTPENARRYFRDFIIHLHRHVERSLAEQVAHYKSLRIEYIFSVPTTWNRDADTLNEVRQIIRDVVGTTQTRRAVIGMTEAAASAVETGQDRFKKGDVVMVCDTGGGTADVNIFKFVSSEKEAARIKSLTYDEGASVGAASIDQAALDYMVSKMRVVGKDGPLWALEAIQTGFAAIKHDHGKSTLNEPFYPLPIPSMTGKAPLSDDFVVGGKGSTEVLFKFPSTKLREWFNDAVDGILKIVDSQLEALNREHRGERIFRVVLSGGFAWNQYYQERLKTYFNDKRREKNKSISQELEILCAPEPELSVVQGLVHNRVRELRGLGPIHESVCCPFSYGVIFAEKYNVLKHAWQGDVPEISALDGRKYMHGQIDWIIKKGVPVPSKGIKKEYDIMLNEKDEKVPRAFQIVTSDHPRDRLPSNISHSAVKPVCDLSVDLTKLNIVDRQSKGGGGFLGLGSRSKAPVKGTGSKETSFDLFLLIGAADLRFEVKPRGEEDTLASSEHDQIDVVWAGDEGAARPDVRSSRTDDLLLRRSRP